MTYILKRIIIFQEYLIHSSVRCNLSLDHIEKRKKEEFWELNRKSEKKNISNEYDLFFLLSITIHFNKNCYSNTEKESKKESIEKEGERERKWIEKKKVPAEYTAHSYKSQIFIGRVYSIYFRESYTDKSFGTESICQIFFLTIIIYYSPHNKNKPCWCSMVFILIYLK
jgi:hypothetical protein